MPTCFVTRKHFATPASPRRPAAVQPAGHSLAPSELAMSESAPSGGPLLPAASCSCSGVAPRLKGDVTLARSSVSCPSEILFGELLCGGQQSKTSTRHGTHHTPRRIQAGRRDGLLRPASVGAGARSGEDGEDGEGGEGGEGGKYGESGADGNDQLDAATPPLLWRRTVSMALIRDYEYLVARVRGRRRRPSRAREPRHVYGTCASIDAKHIHPQGKKAKLGLSS